MIPSPPSFNPYYAVGTGGFWSASGPNPQYSVCGPNVSAFDLRRAREALASEPVAADPVNEMWSLGWKTPPPPTAPVKQWHVKFATRGPLYRWGLKVWRDA